jgi:hypothetical protein
MNYGVKRVKRDKRDWVAGGETGIQYKENTNGDWTAYLPTNELQAGNIDSMSCVTFSALKCLAIQIKWLLANNKLPQKTVDFLNGYMINGEPNFSERFTAKMSGTTQQGNWNANVWDSIRKDGLLPESLYPSDFTSWEVWAKEIPAELQIKAKEFLKYFTIKYQWVSSGQPLNENESKSVLSMWLKQSPLQADIPICPNYGSGEVYPCGARSSQHAITIYKIVKDVGLYIADHYNPFKKFLGYLYPTDWTLMGVIEPIVATEPVVPHYQFAVDLNYGLRKNEEVKHLQQCLIFLGLLKEGFDTGNYLNYTREAVLAFLKKYKVTTTWHICNNNGRYVGPLMRSKLNEMFK